MFKLLVCPTAYKGSFTPLEAAQAMSAGLRSFKNCRATVLPLADGGDGTLESLQYGLGGVRHELAVHDALGKSISADWLELPQLAVVELAAASGLAQLGGRKLEALQAHTYGCGELLLDCLQNGQREVVVTLGGSASTDGGMGLLSALGAKFYDANQQLLPAAGVNLLKIENCDLTALERFREVRIKVAVDVRNPLLGESGAAAVFAPQKSASVDQVCLLESGLAHYADLLERQTRRSCRDLPGSGAAGGTAFGLTCAMSAEIVSGFDWLADLLQLDEKIADCDLIVTGEGSFDAQSLTGKVVGGVLERCRLLAKPVWILPARVDASVMAQLNQSEIVQPVVKPGKQAQPVDLGNALKRLMHSRRYAV